MLPRVVVFTTGGTIASRRDPATGGVRAVASGAELLALVPGLSDEVEVELREFASVNGWNMTPAMGFQLAGELHAALARDEIAGAVVTHGTDTLEETAYLIDLTLAGEKPVCFAAAMRNLSDLSPDGPANLAQAIRVAASPRARGHGALVVLSDEVHAARHVTKTHTTRLTTFRSPGHGPVGLVAWDGVRFTRPPGPRERLAPARLEPEVWIVKTASGTDDRLLRAALDLGAAGIAIEGTGAGNVPDAVVPGIAEAQRRGLPVVLTSRCPEGPLSPTYGTPGGGHSLRRLGVILADGLNSPKARIKLMLALGQTRDVAAIRALFERA